MTERLLSDAASRNVVERELDTNFLIEAGAGAGKTTLLVKRMLQLVERKTSVDRIAAVTFTRKAANELRQRFQEKLEERLLALRKDGGDEAMIARLDTALRDIDQAFIGTIHAFCGRLLREHPIEAMVDPGFTEMDEVLAPVAEQSFWERWVSWSRSEGTAEWRGLIEVGIDPRTLRRAFTTIVANPDVHFAIAPAAKPDVKGTRKKVDQFLDWLATRTPAEEPEGGWDKLYGAAKKLRWLRSIHDWSDPVLFCADIGTMSASGMHATLDRWPGDAHEIRDRGDNLFALTIKPLVTAWREHCYERALAFLLAAAREYREERFRTGRLLFGDLLEGAAALLRNSASARRALGERWRYLLVDEFQDTDPMQAEVCLLLASDPSEGTDWQGVRPRDGAIIVVGDPKQSIYRFRRADIRTYEFVKQRFAQFGRFEVLTENFRSIHPIAGFVNAHFQKAFPGTSDEVQAAFAEMQTGSDRRGPHEGVFSYEAGDASRNEEIVALDAELVAGWIAERVARKERRAGDFLVLTLRKEPLEAYANAIARQGLPVTTSGASLLQEMELRELVLVLRALADPSSPLPVAAALEGLFFGLNPAQLWAAKQAGLEFRLSATRDTASARGDVRRVAEALDTLRAWWHLSQREPVDVLLSRILDATGLLPYAASQALGDNRGGALLHLVEAVRGPATDPAPDLRTAIRTIEAALGVEAPDALLMPGRSGAVRVMNLHKAKGLEASVVILAAPCRYKKKEPGFCIVRDARNRASGFLLIKDDKEHLLAQPPGWDALAANESRFAVAEKTRLLYVAATRAKYELVVARHVAGETPAFERAWLALKPILERSDLAGTLTLAPRAAPARRTAPVTVDAIREQGHELTRRHRMAAADGWERRTVTGETKRPLDAPSPDDHVRHIGRGRKWGTVVHRVLEARARGRTGHALTRFAEAVVRDEEVTGATAEDIARLVTALEAEGYWAPGTVAEMPIVTCETEDGRLVLREGVIDAARPMGDGWQVLDWKTDLDRTGGDPTRREMYQGQVDAYAAMWAKLLRVPASGDLVGLGGVTPPS